MYPEEVVKPMKLELTSNGFKELSNDDDIKNMIENGSSVIMVNSVCGCAAANARPGVISSLNNEKIPIIYLLYLLVSIGKLLIQLESLCSHFLHHHHV